MEILKTEKPENEIENIESIELLPSRIWTTQPSFVNSISLIGIIFSTPLIVNSSTNDG